MVFFLNSKNQHIQKSKLTVWTAVEPLGFENCGWFLRVLFRAFLSSFFGYLQAQPLLNLYFATSDLQITPSFLLILLLTLVLSIMVFADCCFCIFLFAFFPIILFAFFSPPAFCFCLCTLKSFSLLTPLCMMDNLLSCHPLNTCCQPLSFENVIGFYSLFNQIF